MTTKASPRARLREYLVQRSETLTADRHQRYGYMFTPTQLCALLDIFDKALAADGSLLELGCAFGWSTVFLNRHLEDRGLADRRYVCVDTFAGFLERDIAYEREHRGKQRHSYRNFRDNSIDRFHATMRANDLDRVEVLQHDVATLDYTSFGPIAFCLVDVDLYLPVQAALKRLLPLMAPGGVIVVDDCDERVEKWDGALQAYQEFVGAHDLPEDIRAHKLGVVRIPEVAG